MHELSMLGEALRLVLKFAEEQQAKEIIKIDITLGTLVDFIPAYAQMFFKMISKDTIAENAVLQLNVTPAKIKCRSCENIAEFDARHMLFSCPNCGSDQISLIAGREFRIESIEVK